MTESSKLSVMNGENEFLNIGFAILKSISNSSVSGLETEFVKLNFKLSKPTF